MQQHAWRGGGVPFGHAACVYLTRYTGVDSGWQCQVEKTVRRALAADFRQPLVQRREIRRLVVTSGYVRVQLPEFLKLLFLVVFDLDKKTYSHDTVS